MTARIVLSAACLAGLALTLPACRSETGFGRGTSMRSANWAGKCVSNRFLDGWERTFSNLLAGPDAVVNNAGNSVSALERTWMLYRYGTPRGPDPTLHATRRDTGPIRAAPNPARGRTPGPASGF